MASATSLVSRGREDAGEERCYGEPACALAQLVLVHLGYGGGVVATDEVIRSLIRVDRRRDYNLMPTAIVGGL